MFAERAVSTTPQPPVALRVNGLEWWFSVAAVTRVERDLFIQVMLTGPEPCTLTFHLRDRVVLGVTAEEILLAACEWLVERGSATHAYIDLAGRRLDWARRQVA